MDVELAAAAQELKLRLPYLRGDNNDKRMAHDFLIRLIADGKECMEKKAEKGFVRHDESLALLDTANRLLISWGNRGSHSFDVEKSEATKLIDACEQALETFRCGKCSKLLWFADSGNAEWVQCQCGELRWRYGKG